MVTESLFFQGNSVIHRFDPRVRVVAGLAFAFIVALSKRWEVTAVALACAVAAIAVAHLSVARVLKRILPLNIFMALLFTSLPFSIPGTPLFHLGPFPFSLPGFLAALLITIKGNAIVLGLIAMLGTMEMEEFGYALHRLRVPDKLTHLFLFTVRYVELLHQEYLRLIRAMKVRGWRPRLTAHTYRTLGYLVGMLLVNSFDRSERILDAMKCRGFRGRFYALRRFELALMDYVFGCVASILVAGLLWIEWT